MILATLIFLASAAAADDTAATAAVPAPAGSGQVAVEDTVKCVREDVTGSIARKRKVCHTVREWEQIRFNAQTEARRITQPGVPTVSN